MKLLATSVFVLLGLAMSAQAGTSFQIAGDPDPLQSVTGGMRPTLTPAVDSADIVAAGEVVDITVLPQQFVASSIARLSGSGTYFAAVSEPVPEASTTVLFLAGVVVVSALNFKRRFQR